MTAKEIVFWLQIWVWISNMGEKQYLALKLFCGFTQIYTFYFWPACVCKLLMCNDGCRPQIFIHDYLTSSPVSRFSLSINPCAVNIFAFWVHRIFWTEATGHCGWIGASDICIKSAMYPKEDWEIERWWHTSTLYLSPCHLAKADAKYVCPN